MENLSQPKPLKLEGQPGRNWENFKDSWRLYSVATGCEKLDTKVQIATFLHVIGEDARDVIKTQEIHALKASSVESIIGKLDSYFLPAKNTSVQRHKFNTRKQAEGEDFNSFLGDLRKIANECDFKTLKDSLIADRIVCGIYNSRIKERLLREEKLTLEKAINICKAAEETEKHIQELEEQKNAKEEAEINEIKKNAMETSRNYDANHRPRNAFGGKRQTAYQYRPARNSTYEARGRERETADTRTVQKHESTSTANADDNACGRCGHVHFRKDYCPAKGKVCKICNKVNHFARMCYFNKQKVNVIEQDEQSENFVLESIINKSENIKEINCMDWFINVFVIDCKKTVKCKLDTGAQINVLPFYICKRLNLLNKITPSEQSLKITNYGGNELQVFGSLKLLCQINDKNYELVFVVLQTNENAAPIVGIKTIKELDLLKLQQINAITKESVLANYKHLFNGIGKIKNYKCDFKLKENYTPVVTAIRKVALGLQNKLKTELERMEKDKIIEKITEPTEFVHPIVIVNKPSGDIRICLDPQNLNMSLQREHYKLPTFEELTNDLAGSQYFTVLDANKGFWQIELTEKAAKLTTFGTPFGRYKFLRLPFGISRNIPQSI